jgi:hypothetical protein
MTSFRHRQFRIAKVMLGAPRKLQSLAGQQHGRIVPLADIRDATKQKAPDNAGALSFSKC